MPTLSFLGCCCLHLHLRLQPAWSAYREPSFGHGRLYLLSSTTAVWQWMRNQDSHMSISDEVQITRVPRCSMQR